MVDGGPSLGAVLAMPDDARVSDADEAAANEKETMFLWACVLGILALAVTLAIGAILEQRHVRRLPEAGVGVLVGAMSAALASNLNADMLDDERFDFEFFLVWLLPPIIFAAGFNIDLNAFFGSLGPTLFFAFIGTLLSTFVVGGLVYGAGQLGWCYPLGLCAALVFGALISATDPVSVLAVFQAHTA